MPAAQPLPIGPAEAIKFVALECSYVASCPLPSMARVPSNAAPSGSPYANCARLMARRFCTMLDSHF
jgi:hypothetical protein